MRFLLTLIIISSSLLLIAQDTKRIKNTISKTEYETYQVLKSDKKTKQGEYALFVNSKLVTSGFYLNGKKDSIWTTYSGKNTIESQGYYKDDLKEGEWIMSRDFGTSKGNYINGNKSGEWFYYGDKEQLEAKGSFENNQRVGIWEFYNKGDLYQTYNFETKSLTYAGVEGADTLNGIPDGIYKGLIFVDKIAHYKKGDGAMYRFLGMNMKYPPVARDHNIQGRVYVSFIIDSLGNTTHIKILRGIGGGCDEESMRVIELTSGNWNPAQFEGVNVASKFNLPLVFKLQ